MSKPALLSQNSLRIDSRKPLEIRPTSFLLGTQNSQLIDGSAFVEQGLTRVAATVFGPRDARLSMKSGATNVQQANDRASINVQVTYAAFAGNERRKRAKGDRRTVEFAAAIKNTFEPVITTLLYPRAQIDIAILILEQDGSVMSAAINATTLALIHAGISLSSPVSSVTLSCLHDTPLLDPCAPEENDLPTVTIACLAPPRDIQDADDTQEEEKNGKITLVNMETRLSIDRFEALLNLGAQACAVISAEIDDCIRAWAEDTQERMAGSAVATAGAQPNNAMDEE